MEAEIVELLSEALQICQLLMSKIKLSTREIWVGRTKISVSDFAINQSVVPCFFNLNYGLVRIMWFIRLVDLKSHFILVMVC